MVWLMLTLEWLLSSCRARLFVRLLLLVFNYFADILIFASDTFISFQTERMSGKNIAFSVSTHSPYLCSCGACLSLYHLLYPLCLCQRARMSLVSWRSLEKSTDWSRARSRKRKKSMQSFASVSVWKNLTTVILQKRSNLYEKSHRET